MPRISAAIFLVTICFAPVFVRADDAANKQCPAGLYDSKVASGEVVNGKTNLYGQECADTVVRGYCRAADDCHAQTCFIDGAWKDCPTSTEKVDNTGGSSGGTSGSGSATVSPDTQNLTPDQRLNQAFQDTSPQQATQSTGGLTQQKLLQSAQQNTLQQLNGMSGQSLLQSAQSYINQNSAGFSPSANLNNVSNLPVSENPTYTYPVSQSGADQSVGGNGPTFTSGNSASPSEGAQSALAALSPTQEANGSLTLTCNSGVMSCSSLFGNSEWDTFKTQNLPGLLQENGIKTPVIIDNGTSVSVLDGSKYGLSTGSMYVSGSHWGGDGISDLLGTTPRINQDSVSSTLQNGFNGWGADGIAAQAFFSRTDPSTGNTLAQDVGTVVSDNAQNSSFLNRYLGGGTPTISVGGAFPAYGADGSPLNFAATDVVGSAPQQPHVDTTQNVELAPPQAPQQAEVPQELPQPQQTSNPEALLAAEQMPPPARLYVAPGNNAASADQTLPSQSEQVAAESPASASAPSGPPVPASGATGNSGQPAPQGSGQQVAGNPNAGGSGPAVSTGGNQNSITSFISGLLGGLGGSSAPAPSYGNQSVVFVTPFSAPHGNGYAQVNPTTSENGAPQASSSSAPTIVPYFVPPAGTTNPTSSYDPLTQLLKLAAANSTAPANNATAAQNQNTPVNSQPVGNPAQSGQPSNVQNVPGQQGNVAAAPNGSSASSVSGSKGNQQTQTQSASSQTTQSNPAPQGGTGGLQANSGQGTGGAGTGTGNGIGSGSQSGVQTFAQNPQQEAQAKNCQTLSCWVQQQFANLKDALSNPGQALANLVSPNAANAQSYDPRSGQALADAVNVACKSMPCNAPLLQRAFGGVCGIESTCDATQPHAGSQYQGFGQLGTQETYTAIRQLTQIAQSPNLSDSDRQMLSQVITAATQTIQQGGNPNKNPVVGPWLLVALHSSLGTLQAVSAATNDPRTASTMLECAQFAPATCSHNFNLNSQLGPASAQAFNLQHLGWYYPGMTVGQASQQLFAAASGKFTSGINFASQFTPNGSAAPIPANYATAGNCMYRGCSANPTIQPGNAGYAPGIQRVAQCPNTGLCYSDPQTGASGVPSDPNMTRDQFVLAAREDIALERLAQAGKLPQGATFQNFTATASGTANAPVPPRQNIAALITSAQQQFGCSGAACNGKMIDYKNPQGLPSNIAQGIQNRFAQAPASNSTQIRAAVVMADYIACQQLGNQCGRLTQANEDRSSGTERHPNGYAIDVSFNNPQQQAAYAAAFIAAAHSLSITPGMGFSTSCDSTCIVHADTAGSSLGGGTGWAYGGSCGNGSASCISNISDQRVQQIAQLAAQGQDVPDSLLPQSSQSVKTYTIKNQNGDTVAENVPLPDGAVAGDGSVQLLADKNGNPLGADGKNLGSGSQPLLVASNATLPQGNLDPTNGQKLSFTDDRPAQPQRPIYSTVPTGYPTGYPNGANSVYGGQQYCLMQGQMMYTVPCGQNQAAPVAGAQPIAQASPSYPQTVGQTSGIPISPTPTPLPSPIVNASSTPAVRPALTILASQSTVASGTAARISWSSVGTWSCSVYAPDNFLIGTTTHGSVLSSPLSTTSTFTALCLVQGATSIAASTTVIVQ